jgi:hypothetical protein
VSCPEESQDAEGRSQKPEEACGAQRESGGSLDQLQSKTMIIPSSAAGYIAIRCVFITGIERQAMKDRRKECEVVCAWDDAIAPRVAEIAESSPSALSQLSPLNSSVLSQIQSHFRQKILAR